MGSRTRLGSSLARGPNPSHPGGMADKTSPHQHGRPTFNISLGTRERFRSFIPHPNPIQTRDTTAEANPLQTSRSRFNTNVIKHDVSQHHGHGASNPLLQSWRRQPEESVARDMNMTRRFGSNRTLVNVFGSPLNSPHDGQHLNHGRPALKIFEPTAMRHEDAQKFLVGHATTKSIGRKTLSGSVQAGDHDHHLDNEDPDSRLRLPTIQTRRASKRTLTKPKYDTTLPNIAKGSHGHDPLDNKDPLNAAVTLEDFYKGMGNKSQIALPKKLPLSALKAHLLRQARQYNDPSPRSDSVGGGVFKPKDDELYGFDSFYKTNGGHHRDALSRLHPDRVAQLYAGFTNSLQGAADSARDVMRHNYNLQAKQWIVSPAKINYAQAERRGETYRMDDEYRHVPYDENSPARSMLHQLRNFAVSVAGEGIYGEKEQENRRLQVSICRRRIGEEHRLRERDELPTQDLDERENKELRALQHLVQQYDLHKEMRNVHRIRNVRAKKPLVRTAFVLQHEEAQLQTIVSSKLSGAIRPSETNGSVLVGHEAMDAWFAAEGKGAARARVESMSPTALEARKVRKAERHLLDTYVAGMSTQAQEQALRLNNKQAPVLVPLRQFVLRKRAMEHVSGADNNELALAYVESKAIEDNFKTSITNAKQGKNMKANLDALTNFTTTNLREKLDEAEERVRKGERKGMLPQDRMLNDLRDFYFKLHKAMNRTGKETPKTMEKYHEEAELASRKITTYQTQMFRPPHFHVDPRAVNGREMPRELALLMAIKEDYDVISSLTAQRSNLTKGTWKDETHYKPPKGVQNNGNAKTVDQIVKGIKLASTAASTAKSLYNLFEFGHTILGMIP
ncbi:hypothetical protein DL93DRAFT_2087687 [Clavulina sp. PMI_390]|nr:hypothetical protein DL93DRAFT_2087687 [Clavulina sp. PMI_390]